MRRRTLGGLPKDHPMGTDRTRFGNGALPVVGRLGRLFRALDSRMLGLPRPNRHPVGASEARTGSSRAKVRSLRGTRVDLPEVAQWTLPIALEGRGTRTERRTTRRQRRGRQRHRRQRSRGL